MNAKVVIWVGLAIAIAIAWYTTTLEPMEVTLFNRFLAVQLFTMCIILFNQQFFRVIKGLVTRHQIFGGQVLATGVVLLSTGFVVPSMRLVANHYGVCLGGSACWKSVSNGQLVILLVAMFFIVASKFVPTRAGEGSSVWRFFAALLIGSALAWYVIEVTKPPVL